MRVLHQLRNTLNELINQGIIDESDTSVVVETAREMNDANWRAAINKYQRDREKENAKYRQELLQYMPQSKITSIDIDKLRLWEEQGKRCLYTGNIITLSQLLNHDFEIEHTIPRSISFDDSLANKTICDTSFNAYKNNRFPSELPEYETILLNILPWMDKIKHLEKQITTQRNNSRNATTKEAKDRAIISRHILEIELDYWRNKVSRFTCKREDWKDSFRNNQLNDTRIITKYAYHFLKTVFGDVTVQRGDMTANFRKALGVQSLDKKKNRDLHAHHAIDATILTLIPTNTKRDKLLELFYQKEELLRLGQMEDYQQVEKEYNKVLRSCDIKGVENVVSYIENNIIVRHQSKDQSLTPARRRQRVRGKVTINGQQTRWITGDSLRGSLHQETWYGAIAMPKVDEKGCVILDEKGNIVPDTEHIKFVVRRPLSEDSFSNWQSLEKDIVDKALYQMLRKQYPTLEFKDACKKGLYMLDNFGNRINRIRHIRCYTTVTNPVAVKAQTYPSKHTHKLQYWAKVGDLSYMVKYQSEDGIFTQFVPYSLYAISQNRKYGLEDIPQSILGKKQQKLNFVYALRSGISVLLYQNHADELKGVPNNELSKRLYTIQGFESPASVKLVHHLSAKTDSQLGKGESIKDWVQLPEKIRCGINTLKFLVEGVDFEITTSGIEFK
jgi:CRISPR-associated endonuclease Csn1